MDYKSLQTKGNAYIEVNNLSLSLGDRVKTHLCEMCLCFTGTGLWLLWEQLLIHCEFKKNPFFLVVFQKCGLAPFENEVK